MKKSNLVFLSVLLITWIFTHRNVMAQEKPEKKWSYLVEPYLMFPNIKGDLGVRNLPSVSVDANESDILGNLKFGAMVYVEATNENGAVGNDFIYMKLEQGLETSQLVQGGKATVEEFAWELSGLKRINSFFELGLGTRLMSVGSDIEVISARETQTASISKIWVDPILIARTKGIINDKWLWQVRGDIGGWGIGSQFTWQAQVYAGYQFSKVFQTTLGYRYIGVDYDKGDGEDRFRYDIDTYGWVLRLGFNFCEALN